MVNSENRTLAPVSFRVGGRAGERAWHGLTTHPGQPPHLIALHGFTGAAEAWHTAFAHLPADLCALAVDLPGHGAPAAAPLSAEAFTMAGAAADVAALARHVNAGAHPPVVLGYSMGGRLALYAALEHPSAFAALVLESASPGLKTEAERAERRAADERLAVMLETDGLAVFVEHWERLPLFASQARIAPEARAAVRERRLRGDAAGWAASLRGMGTGAQPSMWERLGEWAKPTLLLTGRDDAKFTALADAMQAAGLRAEHTVFEAAGHAVHVEQPAAWAARVSAFVRDALGA